MCFFFGGVWGVCVVVFVVVLGVSLVIFVGVVLGVCFVVVVVVVVLPMVVL